MTDVLRSPDGTAYEVFGGSGAPVVALIHGLGLSRRLWDDHVDPLAESFRVVNYDLYGHGDSAPPAVEASLTLYSEQLRALLDHLGVERAAIIGFSIGGMINRRFAIDHGHRLWALAILNSPHDRGDAAQAEVERRAASVRKQGPMATMDEALLRWFTPAYLESDSAGPGLVRSWRNRADPEGYAQATWVLANGVRELTDPRLELAGPALVMTGEHDSGSTPAMAAAIAEQFREADTVIVPDLQHLGLMERPELFWQPVVRFCERHQP